MKPILDSQELACRFNEDEAVWKEYEYLRRLHRRFRLSTAIPNDLLDRIDWLTAERKHRVVRCIGRALS
jgi:hypothetical protein